MKVVKIIDTRIPSEETELIDMDCGQFFLIGKGLYCKTNVGFISVCNGHHQEYGPDKGIPVKV